MPLVPPSINSPTQGDSCELLKTIPDDMVQCVIADPPHCNVVPVEWDEAWKSDGDYLDWCDTWVNECMRVLREDGLCHIFGQLGKRQHVFVHLMSRLCQRHRFHDLVIWDRVVGYERRDSFAPAYEMILALKRSERPKFMKDAVREPYDQETIQRYLKDKRYKDQRARLEHLRKGKCTRNILAVPSLRGSSSEKCGHPTQKPLRLIEQFVLSATEPGDIVLDPFLGSGSTAVAAEINARRWIGFEIDPRYIAMAEARLAELRMQKTERERGNLF